ncbi:phosphate/phosphite/phosphonate ABC transporter substrate-binding protein [Hwanghaeella sp.]|uniref:phosphate/phosphite/phosphonate ABC transporter substrate-binding protein n=1 Tax=Hwanghaeella sp. TaxID=2605943 RepID=UPI003CCB80F0
MVGFPRKLFLLVIFCASTALLSACEEQDQSTQSPEFSDGPGNQEQIYVFGIHPLHNPERLHEIFGPLMRHLEAKIPEAKFRLEASRNYAAYDEKLYSGKFHFSLPNPFQTINSLKHGYRVFGKMGDDHNFRGIILVRKDSGIEKVEDLKGKPVSFPAPSALAATMMPQFYLQTNGLDVMKDLDIRYVGSQESSIMNVFLGDTVAGATWPPPWRLLAAERPQLSEELEIKWQTDPLPNNGLVARGDVASDLVDEVAAVLFGLHEHEAGRALLHRMDLSRFERADNDTFQSVVDFVEVFAETVRPVD